MTVALDMKVHAFQSFSEGLWAWFFTCCCPQYRAPTVGEVGWLVLRRGKCCGLLLLLDSTHQQQFSTVMFTRPTIYRRCLLHACVHMAQALTAAAGDGGSGGA